MVEGGYERVIFAVIILTCWCIITRLLNKLGRLANERKEILEDILISVSRERDLPP